MEMPVAIQLEFNYSSHNFGASMKADVSKPDEIRSDPRIP